MVPEVVVVVVVAVVVVVFASPELFDMYVVVDSSIGAVVVAFCSELSAFSSVDEVSLLFLFSICLSSTAHLRKECSRRSFAGDSPGKKKIKKIRG